MTARNIGIVGTGAAASAHFRVLQQVLGLTVRAACSRSPDRAREIAKSWQVDAYSSVSDMVRAGKIDITLVATENHRHVPDATEAVLAGSHVLIEKPIGCGPAGVAELIRLSKQFSRSVGVVLQKRFDPGLAKLKQLVRSGYFGEILHVRVDVFMHRTDAYFREKRWLFAPGSGRGALVQHFAIHYLDAVCWLFDARIKESSTWSSGKARSIQAFDTAGGFFELTNGNTVTFCFSVSAPEAVRNSIDIIGTRGCVGYKAGQLYDIAGGAPVLFPDSPGISTTETELVRLWQHFAACATEAKLSEIDISTVLQREYDICLLYAPAAISKE